MSEEQDERLTGRDRRGWLAGLLGFFFPGLGHLYAGDLRGALLWGALAIGASMLLSVLGLTIGPTFAVIVTTIALSWAIQIASCVAAVRAARAADRPFELRPYNRFLTYVGFSFALLVVGEVVSHVNRTFVTEALKFPSGSMEPTVRAGEHLMADRTVSGADAAEPGNIVTFTFPRADAVDYLATRPQDERRCVDPSMLEVDDRHLAKRIVATGGQTVSIINGQMTIDAEPVERVFVSKDPTGGSLYPFYVIERETLPSGPSYQIQHHGEPWPPFEMTVPDGHVFVLGDSRDNSSDSRCWGTVPVENIRAVMMWVWWSSGEDGLNFDRLGHTVR